MNVIEILNLGYVRIFSFGGFEDFSSLKGSSSMEEVGSEIKLG